MTGNQGRGRSQVFQADPGRFRSEPLQFEELSVSRMLQESDAFRERICKRRTVREFAERYVDPRIIENAIRAAGSAPSGANKQPWHFVAVFNPELKKRIRLAAEEEERTFYGGGAPDSWLKDLEQFGTDASKPFLEAAPCLIAVFLQRNSIDAQGNKNKNYYMPESVGIATGILLTALHFSGLVTLTHTPSPMGFLNEILQRPKNEKPFLLIVTGYPDADASVPTIERKGLEEMSTFF